MRVQSLVELLWLLGRGEKGLAALHDSGEVVVAVSDKSPGFSIYTSIEQ